MPPTAPRQAGGDEKDDKKLVEEIYLSCLSRPPTEKEVAASIFPRTPARSGADGLALLNQPAFLFNR